MSHMLNRYLNRILLTICCLLASVSLAQGGTLTVAQPFDAQTLDPNVQINQMSMNVYINIFDSLLIRDEEMVPQPHLATSVERIDDLTWELRLREDVTFHNGERFDAHAVKFTLERIFDPETRSNLVTWLGGMGEVEIIDDFTLRIHTEWPMPIMEQNLVMVYPVPPQYVTEVGNQQFNLNPVGTGPYRLERWVRDEQAVLAAYEDYWRGPPPYEQVVFRFIPEEASRVAALLAGEIDIAQGVTASSAPLIEQRQGLEVRSVPAGRVMLLQLDVETQNECLLNQSFRRAVALAIDTEALIEFVAMGEGFPINTVVHPRNFGHNPNIEPYPYDPDAAAALVAETGCQGTEFVINVNPERQFLGEAIAGQLQAIGLNASTATFEANVWLARWQDHTLGGQAFVLGLLSQTWDADGLLFLRFGCGEPMEYYCEERLDHLVRHARAIVDEEERLAAYHEALELIHDEAPLIPLYGVTALFGVRESITYEPRTDELMYLFDASPR